MIGRIRQKVVDEKAARGQDGQLAFVRPEIEKQNIFFDKLKTRNEKKDAMNDRVFKLNFFSCFKC